MPTPQVSLNAPAAFAASKKKPCPGGTTDVTAPLGNVVSQVYDEARWPSARSRAAPVRLPASVPVIAGSSASSRTSRARRALAWGLTATHDATSG